MENQYGQYNQYSWQSQHPPNNQFAQQPMTIPQGMVMDNQQYLNPQTQATTYSSTATTTTTHEQTSSSNAQYYDQSYMPQPQQTILSSSQWSDQSHALQYEQPTMQQHVTPQWQTSQTNTVQSDQFNALQYQPQVVQQQQQQQPAVPQWSTAQTNTVQQDMQYLNSGFAQLLQVAPQPQQPLANEYAPLMQTSPTPQQSTANDFAQLTQAAPPAPVTIAARIAAPPAMLSSFTVTTKVTAPPAKASASTVKTKVTAPPAKATSSTVTTKTTKTTTTEKYEGANAGGKARKTAEKEGDVEVKRFEKKVQKLIRSIGVCPMDWPWYCDTRGYICAEGIHFLYHKDIDMAVTKPGWIPEVTWVNTFDTPDADIEGMLHSWHPPPVDLWQPMHQTHKDFQRRARRMLFSVSKTFGGNDDEKGKSRCEAAGCWKGMHRQSISSMKADVRAQGYNPEHGRHNMFRDGQG